MLMLVPGLESFSQETRIVFYNVENLFDTDDDPLTRDEEFLPEGEKRWTYERYWRKVVRIYQVITAIGEGDMPALVGLCEIENRKVLEKLVYGTPLNRYPYRIVHQDSPDPRGIDVALIYRADYFQPDSAEWLPVALPDGSKTRDVLHVRGVLWNEFPVHIYVNHWPSRYGGVVASQARRLAAASVLKRSLEEVSLDEHQPNIIIMGDFNDEPGDLSLKRITSLKNPHDDDHPLIINLSDSKAGLNVKGTIKHQGAWSVFDQVLVSSSLIAGNNGLNLSVKYAEAYGGEFLLEPDETYVGTKPYRTYLGPGYHGGFSDHLPVSVLIRPTRLKP